MTKYTFLLPAFKPDFLEVALRSIKSQTLKDFKVLVSDDCSPYDLKSIYDKVCGDDPRFSYRRNEKNIGGKSLVEHWNLLVDLCETDFFIMASDDDIYSPDFLEELDSLICKYPNVDLFHARAHVINERDEVTMNDALYNEFASQMEFMASYGNQGHVECVPNYIYRTKRIKEIGGFVDFPLAWCSDTATNNLMAENGCATSKNILFSFRMSGENISSISKKNNEITKQKIKAAYMFYCHLEQLFNKIPQPSSKLEQYVRSSAYRTQMGIVKTSFSYFSSVLSFQEFLRLIKFMRKRSLVTDKYEVMRMFAKWWYAKRHK